MFSAKARSLTKCMKKHATCKGVTKRAGKTGQEVDIDQA